MRALKLRQILYRSGGKFTTKKNFSGCVWVWVCARIVSLERGAQFSPQHLCLCVGEKIVKNFHANHEGNFGVVKKFCTIFQVSSPGKTLMSLEALLTKRPKAFILLSKRTWGLRTQLEIAFLDDESHASHVLIQKPQIHIQPAHTHKNTLCGKAFMVGKNHTTQMWFPCWTAIVKTWIVVEPKTCCTWSVNDVRRPFNFYETSS